MSETEANAAPRDRARDTAGGQLHPAMGLPEPVTSRLDNGLGVRPVDIPRARYVVPSESSCLSTRAEPRDREGVATLMARSSTKAPACAFDG